MARFDAAHRQDPNVEVFEGELHPKELLYAQRLSAWLLVVEPDASEILRLAARAQHLYRWRIPRADYPMDRQGYLAWRGRLAMFHVEHAAEILRQVGYDEATIARVQALVRKENLKRDPEAQTLEDAVCLLFLEHELGAFAPRVGTEKLGTILRQTWHKMSPRGRHLALEQRLLPADMARDLLPKSLPGADAPSSPSSR
ncbi:MAG: DUF4202 domain-containing protein [Candidatus Tectomicrobia bacterium]|nr:DUF4202 domain-containing protein [Candidatus Tectomicrobia bacterium]